MFEQSAASATPPSEGFPIAKMNAAQCLEVISHADGMKSYYDSRKAQALARFAELRRPTRWGTDLADNAPEEVAVELGISPRTAATHIQQARSLVTRLPGTLAALSAGKIDYKRAQAINDLTSELSNEDARTVEQRVLDGGRRANPSKFRDAVRYQVIKADPEGAERRRTEAREHRNVTFMPGANSMGKLAARLTADETIAAHRRITMLAQRVKTPDRTMGQCRADVLMDLLLGKDAEHLEVQVNVTVPMTSLMGLNELPGEITGYGPITAGHARELAKNATWRRIITDPHGQVLETGPRQPREPDVPTPANAHDHRCPQPGFTTPAHDPPDVDLDEISRSEIGSLCERRASTAERADQLKQSSEQELIATSPEGASCPTIQEPYGDLPF